MGNIAMFISICLNIIMLSILIYYWICIKDVIKNKDKEKDILYQDLSEKDDYIKSILKENELLRKKE